MDLVRWADRVKVGERVVYHKGPSALPDWIVRTGELVTAQGTVFLAQRRLKEGVFAYEATRISKQCAYNLGLIGPSRAWRDGNGPEPEPRRPTIRSSMAVLA